MKCESRRRLESSKRYAHQRCGLFLTHCSQRDVLTSIIAQASLSSVRQRSFPSLY
ncbi:hypothetical protein BDR06DRAFT_965644 [Suillus hirtellus]|nr:hypothetical protein BDR06DRAFT_965644 [Suillus hirtellus]